ncbi:MAG: AbrB/MazE/SpoVT family DNA-binding domain-containing protein [Spirochaetaceae bacterium]|jgi:antitoxin MazE|nr:AbrB/MazE/SpoVT family DNA-binding domain-containing protein [Spirochaetaceae bacterium]
MLASIISIGNSRGIRIPQNILDQLNFNEKVEMEVRDNKLIVSRIESPPRQGWEKAFSKAHESVDSCESSGKALLISDMIDNDVFEWEWQ